MKTNEQQKRIGNEAATNSGSAAFLKFIPDGWELRETNRGVEITVPNTVKRPGGGVTLYWKTRRFALGYHTRPQDNAQTYTGRDWKARMVTDAVKALDAALIPFRKS